MLPSGSHLVTAGEEVHIKVEAIPMAIENDRLVAESSGLTAATIKVEHEITPGDEEDETNHSGASLKPYHSAFKQKECSNLPAFYCDPVFGEELVHIKQEPDLVQVQEDPFKIESFDSATVTVKTESEFTPGDETNHSGEGWEPYHSASKQTTNDSYMSASGNSIVVGEESVPIKREDSPVLIRTDLSVECYNMATAVAGSELAVKHETNLSSENGPFSNIANSHVREIKREELEVGTEDETMATKYINQCNSNSMSETDLILFKEEDLDMEEEEEEESKTLVNIYPGVSYDTSAEISNVCESGSGADNLKKWQPTYYETDSIKLNDASGVLEEFFHDNPEEYSQGFIGKHTNSKSCTCVMCTEYVPEIEIINFGKNPKPRKSKKVKYLEKIIRLEKVRLEKIHSEKIRLEKKRLERVRLENIRLERFRKEGMKGLFKEEWARCNDCPARFKFTHDLKRHLTAEHSVHLCVECCETFESRSDLQTHMKEHPRNNLYGCVFCSFKVGTEAELKIHARSHFANKAFSCAKCHVEFDTNSDLLKHVRMHLYEKQCIHCAAKFSDKRSLNRHVALHLYGKQFNCLNCKAKFSRSENLKRHVALHANEKPFSCPYCTMSFQTQEHLNQHLYVHVKDHVSFVAPQEPENQDQRTRDSPCADSSAPPPHTKLVFKKLLKSTDLGASTV